MDKTFLRHLYQSHQTCATCASPGEVAVFFTDLLGVLFADYTPHTFASEKEFEDHFNHVRLSLAGLLKYNPNKGKNESEKVVEEFYNLLPYLYKKINEDVTAMFEGDPAAKSRSEVIRTYPGFYAIAAYRVAHG